MDKITVTSLIPIQEVCDDCGGHFECGNLVKCLTPDEFAPGGETEEWLCDTCIEKGKCFCRHCGAFCAGISSFEFGPGAGFCDNCWDQIQDSCADHPDDDEEDGDGMYDSHDYGY